MKRKWFAYGLALLCAASFTGCGAKKAYTDKQTVVAEIVRIVDTADPETAVEKIYEGMRVPVLETAGQQELEDLFYITPDMVDDYYVSYSSGKYGVADVFILKPADEKEAQVMELLEQVKMTRIKEFERYDIYNSYQVAKDAPIFEQGEYVIMLMVEDAERARSIIDQYIPKN